METSLSALGVVLAAIVWNMFWSLQGPLIKICLSLEVWHTQILLQIICMPLCSQYFRVVVKYITTPIMYRWLKTSCRNTLLTFPVTWFVPALIRFKQACMEHAADLIKFLATTPNKNNLFMGSLSTCLDKYINITTKYA